jgi:hypothetical protein
MSEALAALLARGDDLIARHRKVLPSLALDWLRNQPATALLELAQEIEPHVHIDVTQLERTPSGTVDYPLQKGTACSLGSIRVVVNPDGTLSGDVEIRSSHGRFEKKPIEGLEPNHADNGWLIVALKRAEAIMEIRG